MSQQLPQRRLSPAPRTPLQRLVRHRALRAFGAAMEEAPHRLEALHQALEKSQRVVVIRGAWQGRTRQPDRGGRGDAACPLAILFADEKRDVHATVRASETALARHVFTPADFYDAWDRGLISVQELLRIVDRRLTAALLGGKELRGL